MTTVERIDELLKGLKISRRQLAIAADIPPSSLQSAMERNKPLSFEMQEKISSALHVSIFEILGDDERELYVDAEAGTIYNYLQQGYKFTDNEGALVRLFNGMNNAGGDIVLSVAEAVAGNPRYKATPAPKPSTEPPRDETPGRGTDTTPPLESSEGTQKLPKDKK